MNLLKKAVRKALERRGLYTTWAAPDQVAGLGLQRDLSRVIPNPRPLCIDVGGNKGQTVELFREAWDSPTIHVFEPTSRLVDLLRAKYQPPAVTVHHLALGDVEGEAELRCYSADDMNSLLNLDPHSHQLLENVTATGTETVRVCRLDDYLSQLGLEAIDLLKIDTQGFDGRVLRGAERLLTEGNVRAVMVELNFVGMYEDQSQPGEILQWLNDRGYRPVDLYEKVRGHQDIAWCTGLFVRAAATPPTPAAVDSVAPR